MIDYVTSSGVVDWMMFDDGEYACRKVNASMAKERHFLRWNELPEGVPIDSIRSLRLITRPDGPVELPTALATLSELENLSIPRSTVRMLKSDQIPRSVRFLTVSGGRAATWAPSVLMPNVEKLTSSDGLLKFDSRTFPHLETLTLKIGPNRTMIDVIAQHRAIRGLRLITVTATDIIARVGELPLREFGLASGNIDSIEPIGQMKKLKEVYLHSLPKLKSLKGLEELRELTTFSILYCKNIGDIERTLFLPNLRRLTIVGCGNLGLARFQERLEAMNLEELVVGATR